MTFLLCISHNCVYFCGFSMIQFMYLFVAAFAGCKDSQLVQCTEDFPRWCFIMLVPSIIWYDVVHIEPVQAINIKSSCHYRQKSGKDGLETDGSCSVWLTMST